MNKPLKVIVAEDNPGDFHLLETAILKLPFATGLTHFTNGQELIDFALNNTLYDFDFILLDLNMPMVNGYEVLEFMQKHPNIGFPP